MRVLRWLVVSFLILSALLLVVLLRKPKWPGQEALPKVGKGFERKCNVTRDVFDVPHITAKTDEAAMYCWGRTQAEDRAWQMDYLRRLAYGRLAELYGSKHLRQDFFLKILKLDSTTKGWVDTWKKTLTQEEKRFYRLTRFYVWGVNDGFKVAAKGPNRPYMWKGKLKSYQPPPWRIQDTLAVALLQSFFQTRRAFTDDIKHERLRVALGLKRYTELYGRKDRPHRHDHTIIKAGEHPMVPKLGQSKPSTPTKGTTRPAPRRRTQLSPKARQWKMAALQSLRKLLGPLGRETGEGSNNWSVGANRSASGHAMLANDPHLSITTPAFWYEVHLKSRSYDVLGFGVPGTPSIMSGNNRFVAWGVTNGFTNTADVVRIKPNKKGVFQLGKQTLKVTKFKPTVYVRVGPFYLPIFWKKFEHTKVGPILPISWKSGEKLLLRWSGYHLTRSPLVPVMGVLEAKSAKQIDAIFQQWQLPCWNMVFADTKGNYGYRQIGLLPRRQKGTHGMMDGSNPKESWQGFLKPEEAPAVMNQPRGFVSTANNQTFPHHYPLYMGHNFYPGYRGRRIDQLLGAKSKHTLEDMKRIQLDVKVATAALVLSAMLKRVMEEKPKLSDNAKKALKLLASWDKRATRGQVGPTLFRVWFHWLHHTMFALDAKIANPKWRLKGKPKDAPHNLYLQGKGIKVLPGPYAVLDVLNGTIQPGTGHSVPLLLQMTLEKTVNQLKRYYKGGITTWKWGKYHRNHFYHLSGKNKKFQPEPQGKDGDEHTVNVAQSKGVGPFWVRNASSLRLLVEMDPKRIKSMAVLAGKQKDVAPTKLGQQQKLWLNNKYRIRPFYPDEVKKHTKKSYTISW